MREWVLGFKSVHICTNSANGSARVHMHIIPRLTLQVYVWLCVCDDFLNFHAGRAHKIEANEIMQSVL